ncbi:MAG: hypothetical protein ACE3JP_12355 [Ectobacillus sp.]
MLNVVYFIILSILGTLLFGYTMWRTQLPRGRVLTIFFVISGISYILEYVIFVLFHSYDYYPKVLKEQWFDSLLGAIVSQAMVVPVIGMCIVAFHLRFYWILMFAALLMGIEEYFLHLGIYEQHWWKTGYTGILVIIGFSIGKWWNHKLTQVKPWVEWFNIYFAIGLITQTTAYFIVVLMHSHLYSPGWFANSIRDSVAMDALFWFIHSILGTFLIQFWFKWYSMLLLYIVDFWVFTFFEQSGVLRFGMHWNAALLALVPAVLAILSQRLYVRLSKGFSAQ